MNWREQAITSHYRTAVAIHDALEAGRVEDATRGLEELIDALSRSEKRALRSQLIVLMAHVIKWIAQPERRSRSWAATIANTRAEIREIQDETPSLTDAVIREMWSTCFVRATRQAEAEMNRASPLAELSWADVFDAEYQIDPP